MHSRKLFHATLKSDVVFQVVTGLVLLSRSNVIVATRSKEFHTQTPDQKCCFLHSGA